MFAKASLCAALVVMGSASLSLAQLPPVYHPAVSNWDLYNLTGQPVNDFDVIVASPDFEPSWTYNPGGTNQIIRGDFNGDMIVETKIHYVFPTVAVGELKHIGLRLPADVGMQDAYWTFNGVRVGSQGIPYERTKVTRSAVGGSGEVVMQFQAPQLFAGNLTLSNIRAFRDLPAGLITGDQLNSSLILDSLAAFEVTPTFNPVAALPTTGFFEVSLGNTLFTGPEYESLLHATILSDNVVIGEVWTLNAQCPEPAFCSLIAAAAVIPAFRRRR